MIGVPLGLIYSNAWEWVVHKYVLHGLGRRKGSFWSFHWHEHHKNARQHGMNDAAYRRPLTGWNGQSKEALGLALASLAHLPLLKRAPYFTLTVWFCQWNYYRVHKRSHQDPEWAREHLPWHVDHHMGPDQHANWCVTWPWFDYVMGTRKPSRQGERETTARTP